MEMIKHGIVGLLFVIALVWSASIVLTNIDDTELRILVDHGWEFLCIGTMLIVASGLFHWDWPGTDT